MLPAALLAQQDAGISIAGFGSKTRCLDWRMGRA